MSKTLFTSGGSQLQLGRELGKGGEGAVYDLSSQPGQVAKIYHKLPDAKKQAKLAFMASSADARLLNYVAWPQDTLHTSRGGPIAGFLMPKVAGKDPIHMVYSPAHRRQDHPKAAWDFLLFVSRNIAASFDTLHEHGHVIGDVNQNSFMVGRDSKVVLIDSDSFQVNARGTVHLCEVGVSHFTPPELQAIPSFDKVVRTPNHDNFGLALLLFHVLFGGRHPYSGVPLRAGVGEALETDIKGFRYAYARDGQARGIGPPPRSIPMSMLPDGLETMFHRAFTEIGVQSGRPSAQLWVAALDRLRTRLKRCSSSAMHVYPDHLGSCPWCALEQQGVVYFLDLGTVFTPTRSGFVLAQVWGLIQAVQPPSPLSIPSPDSFSVRPRSLPEGVPGKATGTAVRIGTVVVVLGLLLVAPSWWVLWLLLAWGGWSAAGSYGASERAAEAIMRRSALHDAEREYERLVERAKQEAGPEGFHAKRAELQKARDELEALPRLEKAELDKLHSTAHERQKQRFLDTCFIDSASISGVGPARKAALRSFGIETAADVSRHRVMQVKGFGSGLTAAVLDWRASCERRFVFNAATAVSAADRNAVRVKFASHKGALESKLAAAPAQLQQFRLKAAAQMATLQVQLESAARQLAQARADVTLV